MSPASPKPTCFARRLGFTDCTDGLLLHRCHLIPKQRLRDNGIVPTDQWDPRVWIFGCERHHNQLDGRDAMNKITLEREQLEIVSPGIEAYAAEHGMAWSLDRDYGRQTDQEDTGERIRDRGEDPGSRADPRRQTALIDIQRPRAAPRDGAAVASGLPGDRVRDRAGVRIVNRVEYD